MKGDKKVITHLNKIMTNELTAINQYFLHARMFRNWGLKKLGEHEYHESIDEMKHADRLIERENVKECLECDLKAEMHGHPMLKDAIACCEETGDYVSRELFEDILESEEEHIDWIETQLDLIGKVGIQNYMQSQMGEGGGGS
jgi:bacterioferritin